MTKLLLGPLLRHVTTTSATIWVETDVPCAVEVLGSATTTFTVHGHHYGLVIVEGLEPGTSRPYDVRLDGEVHWPRVDDAFPPSVVRTLNGSGALRMLFGSCRASAPHEAPYSLELDHDNDARGVDALRAHALRMLREPEETWPDLIVFLGDQVYADDSSPRTAERIERRKQLEYSDDSLRPPDEIVADFEEYTWLYDEAWTPDVERWILSTVPSTMIFDDHDMIDDWNISESWVRDTRALPWWSEHVIGGLVSYWVYQHLGNLSPERIRDEGLLERLRGAEDGTDVLRAWALESESLTPVPGGYYFSFHRELGSVRLVVVDCRNGRVLDPKDRRMVDDGEWGWIVRQAMEPCDHLVIATSLPPFVPGGLHGLQQWNEVLCAGRWGRLVARMSERLRRALDLEDWPAFDRSFRDLCKLLEVAGSDGPDRKAPSTITVLSGDVHFAYVASASFPDHAEVVSRVRQVVSSPIRNALTTRERRVLRFGISRVGRRIGSLLARFAGREHTALAWEMEHGPFFSNNMGLIAFEQRDAVLTIEQASPDDDGEPVLESVITEQL